METNLEYTALNVKRLMKWFRLILFFPRTRRRRRRRRNVNQPSQYAKWIKNMACDIRHLSTIRAPSPRRCVSHTLPPFDTYT